MMYSSKKMPMKPKFKDIRAWEQAELLLQPAFIRILDNIRKQLELSSWRGTFQEITTPYPGYHLCLTREGEKPVEVDIWYLCYQICFQNYHPVEKDTQEVDIDTSLIDETGEVDWHLLETKAQHCVKEIFVNLPSSN